MADDFDDIRTRLGAGQAAPRRVHPVDFGEVEVARLYDAAPDQRLLGQR